MSGTPIRSGDLDGVTRTAVLLLSLEPKIAATVMRELDPRTVEAVSRTIASLDEVPGELTEEVLEAFHRDRLDERAEGGMDNAASLVRLALDPEDAEQLIDNVRTKVENVPFAFLHDAESASLLSYLRDEHPQTIALVLAHLNYDQAARILPALSSTLQVEVVERLATLEPTHPDVIRAVESGLEHRLASRLVADGASCGGLDAVAEILNRCDRMTERVVLEGIEGHDSDLVEDIRRLLFGFEDIARVDDKGVQSILKEIDNEVLCLAMKTASAELRQKVLGNMSQRAADLITEDMEYLGPVRLSDVEAAQRRIIDVVRRLEDAGEVHIEGRASDDQLIV